MCAAMNFPDAPTVGQTYLQYTWDGEKWVTVSVIPILRGYLSGFTMVWTSGISMSISPGMAADSTGVAYISLSTPWSKVTSAWAAGGGQGGIDTGTFAANSTYYWFVIRNPTNGLVDILFSLSATAPTLPSGYTQFRRIGAMMSTSGGTWYKFVQDGDTFLFDTPVNGTPIANPSTTAFTYLLKVPFSIRVEAIVFLAALANAGSDQAISWYATQTGMADVVSNVAGVTSTAAWVSGAPSTVSIGALNYIFTSSGRIRIRLQGSAAGTTFYVTTFGWRDSRGRDGAIVSLEREDRIELQPADLSDGLPHLNRNE